jgi:DNA-binding response OmpR family regulator
VDDDVSAARLRSAILERAGHIVEVSTSARNAAEMVRAVPFDAVVTDWRLGTETAQELIRAAKDESETPVVVVSGFVAEAFQSAGPMADLYLDKPVNPADLIEILDALLRERCA